MKNLPVMLMYLMLKYQQNWFIMPDTARPATGYRSPFTPVEWNRPLDLSSTQVVKVEKNKAAEYQEPFPTNLPNNDFWL